MNWTRSMGTGLALIALPLAVLAQAGNGDAARSKAPTLSLDAQASKQVPEDTAWAVFAIEKEARDQAQAQQAGKTALADVLAIAKKATALRANTESLYTNPTYSKDGKITGWRTSFNVRIESTDTAQVAQTMSDLMGKARLAGSGFSLSEAVQKKVQDELIAGAVKAFEAKAKTTATAMGFSHFEYNDIQIGNSGMVPTPRNTVTLFSAATAKTSNAGEPMALEPGQTQVTVSISGNVRLLK